MASLAAPAAAASGLSRAPPPSSTQGPPPASPTPAQNAGPHLLSLKVMRASAPSLVVSEKPYYEASEDNSRNPLIEAVGQGIQDGLSHDLLSNRWEGVSSSSAADSFPISPLLVLPNSFGTLYLGETFRTYLCVRNESATAVREPSLRVEMQVGASDPNAGASTDSGRWHQLAHVILPNPTRYEPDPTIEDDQGRPIWELDQGQALETSLGYDIKDLGPHVLVCTVGYKSVSQQDGVEVWTERSFRKFYKFAVDRSPISVRTKVHQPRHASSLYHPEAAVRKRVELEVQVQNVAGNGASLVFTGMALKSAPGWRWTSVDRPTLNSGGETEDDRAGKGKGADMWLYKGTNELLGDGDIRQYLFTLTPSQATSLTDEVTKGGIDLGVSPDGHSIKGDALGHLDISWRMSLGEPGRLQTSQLVRRRVAAPPVTVSSSTTKLVPQLRTQLTLQPSAIDALRTVRVGEAIGLDIDLTICDVSSHLLPPHTPDTGPPSQPTADEDDDDTPLSEIASPRAKPTPTAAIERLSVRRTLSLALQHCVISPPPPLPSHTAPPPLPAALGDDRPSTPRKTPTPSRTSTPVSSALTKVRLQTNLSNLVRNSSLSLRPRTSTDSEGAGRSGSPAPPLPPKVGLAEATVVDEKTSQQGEGEKEERAALPEPTVAWEKVESQYKVHIETHAQALTRPTGHVEIPASFLPTLGVQHLGSSLVPLPPVTLEMHALRSGSTFFRSTEEGTKAEQTVQARLSYLLDDGLAEVVRFGAVRVLLLGWSDEVVDERGERKEEKGQGVTVLQEVLVLAETLVSH